MRYLLRTISIILLLPVALMAQSTVPEQTVPHRILVKVRPDHTLADLERLLSPLSNRIGVIQTDSWLNPALLSFALHRGMYKPVRDTAAEYVLRGLERIGMVVYTGDNSPADVARLVSGIAGIEYAEPVFVRRLSYSPNDPQLSKQTYLPLIHAFSAWDIARADTSIVIAIIDVGIQSTHPDIQDAIWHNPGETGNDAYGRDKRSNGVDDDKNGLIDDWAGYDFGGADGYSPDNDPSPKHWHATHVAGVAAGVGNNSSGIAGVAFGAKLMSVKIGDDASTDPLLTSGFDGIMYAGAMHARVINCSWGGGGKSKAEQEVIDAVTALGSVVVASAGNSGLNETIYPASYHHVLSVASVTAQGERSRFSNYNSEVGISAPGEDVYSTLPRFYTVNEYGLSSGTSMAAPMVSGAAALVASRFPALQSDQIIAVLRASADTFKVYNPVYGFLLGNGSLNIERALIQGTNAAAALVTEIQATDAGGDGALDPGEDVSLRLTVNNLLLPAGNLTARITYSSANTTLQWNGVIGAMSSGQTRTSSPIVITIPSDVPTDYLMPLEIELKSSDTVFGHYRPSLLVNPSYATTSYNRITATFTGNGRIGFADFPSNIHGEGFRRDSAESILAEAGLIIGTSSERIADVVRNEGQNANEGLRTVQSYRVRFDSTLNAQVGSALSSDDGLPTLYRVGIEPKLTTYEFKADSLDNTVIVLYRIRNTSTTTLSNLHVALFCDWDIGARGTGDQVGFDGLHRLGYIRNTRSDSLPYAGIALLSNQPMNFNALDNQDAPLSPGFSLADKWQAISSGISREQSNVGDCSFVIGAGPIVLGPGKDTVIAFAMLATDNLEQLQNAENAARDAYTRLGFTPGPPLVLPNELSLEISGPNPFVDRTSVTARIPRSGELSLELFNALGERVAVLADGSVPRGILTIPVDGSVVSGNRVLFLRLKTSYGTVIQKLIRL